MMETGMASLGKRKLELQSEEEEVISVSSDTDDEQQVSEFSDDDNDCHESSYSDTETSGADSEDASCESSSIREDDEDCIDMSSDSEQPSVSRMNQKVNAKCSNTKAGNIGSRGAAFSQRRANQIQERRHARNRPILDKEDRALYAEAVGLIAGGGVERLRVEHCRAYLRRHSLRRSGSKTVLLERIQEHLEIKGGGGLAKYPRSRFSINCTGDACTGDVVLFKQKVHQKSSTVPPYHKRIVAGRIVKESYGAEKQQHTFTVEVLWSKGPKALPPMYPLIIKGRNLYRLRTFRQPWPNEEERRRILEEKHSRGTAARSAREFRINGKKQAGASWKLRMTHKASSRAEVSSARSKDGSNKKKRRLEASEWSKGTAHTSKMTMSMDSVFQRERTGIEPYGDTRNVNISKSILSIKASLAGVVIGRHGANVNEIKRVSGAKLQVHDDQNPKLRVVEIIGTTEQIRVAREMVLQSLANRGFSTEASDTQNVEVNRVTEHRPYGIRALPYSHASHGVIGQELHDYRAPSFPVYPHVSE